MWRRSLDHHANAGRSADDTDGFDECHDLTNQTVVGVSLQSNPTGTGSGQRLFWAAPLRAPDPGAKGTETVTVTDSGGSGQVDSRLVQETLGNPTPGGSTVRVVMTWSCPFA
jgi:hypothetical protein